MRDFLTTTEVGEALGVGLGTVRKWIRLKELPAYRLKGMRDWRIDRDAFAEFKAARQSGVAK